MNENIVKSAEISSCAVDENAMQKINAYANKELTPEDVYTFKVKLCSNEVDRDLESFTPKALEQLALLFKGKTGIKDHAGKADNQIARIYDTEVITEKEHKTILGEDYTYIEAYAYIMKLPKNEDFIAEIDGGIKKEVSVSCSIAKRLCSVCGESIFGCGHIVGREDAKSGKCCYVRLDEAADAYEFSFVAVPAQRDAGTHKKYEHGEAEKSKNQVLNTLSEVFENII